jgi:hypothetical protein
MTRFRHARGVVGVVIVATNMVGTVADVVEGEVGADWICVSSMVMAVKPSEQVVSEIWQTQKRW